jgi:hypothetical protein
MNAVFTTLIITATTPTLNADLQQFLDWFTGEFDNYQQYILESKSKIENPHMWTHHIFEPINMPQLGKNIFHVTQYRDGNPELVYRRRFYRFSYSEESQAILLEIFDYPNSDTQRFKNLQQIKLEQLKYFPDCIIHWKRTKNGKAFIGNPPRGFCIFTSKYDKKELTVKETLRLSSDEFQIATAAYDNNKKLIWGREKLEPYKNYKCHYYIGWAIIKEGRNKLPLGFAKLIIKDSGEPILLHNSQINTGYSLQLTRESYRGGLKYLKFNIKNINNNNSSFVIGDIDSKRLGIENNYIKAGFISWNNNHFAPNKHKIQPNKIIFPNLPLGS